MDFAMEKRHTHTMEPMSMGAGVPGLVYMQNLFWIFIGAGLAFATAANVMNKILYYQRMAAASKRSPDPARPKSLIFQTHATLATIIREVGYYSSPLKLGKMHLYLPPMGPVLIMIAYMVLIVVTSFYAFHPKNFLEWEDIGYRTGFIAIAQIPFIVLLAGKRNLIGFFTGLGYERLSWLHRWVARALLFTILIHMGYWMTEWGKYNYIMVKLKTDFLTRVGMAAFAILAWLVLSSVAPVRGLAYEVFVVQHIISYLGFLVAVYFHVPAENQKWVWIPLAFWAFDRVVRAGYLFYNNASIFHKNSTGVLACRATFQPLDEAHTRVTILNPPVTWQAGQHMFLACHSLAPLSSHPFTIASLPQDGKMEFIICAKKGGTKRFFNYAQKAFPTQSSSRNEGKPVLIEGPYARIRPLRQFDTLLFIAGSTGATFTMPLMRDLVQQWHNPKRNSKFDFAAGGAVTRHIRFVWVVKRSSSLRWFSNQLDRVHAEVEGLRSDGYDVAVEISVYVTCDNTITSAASSINDRKGPQARVLSSIPTDSDDEKNEITTKMVSRTSSNFSQDNSVACCCTKVVDEDVDVISPPCCCGENGAPSISSYTTKGPAYNLISGRPDIANLIRKSAELALGEMAVVVCGPPGLVQGTRNAAVMVSDDRAVHKGTGAQGIYVHAETFGYA
ncbi:metalloreductase [Coleophoma cylindrospora]|uniref:ferric-chelate reductase (NADPH) n=1 Tax=Coleophoma cylindrospora TaxID=1849047 RepID=A0A3D8S199_9HELO|nr:metalloreductase [Coleophoma cylindrospora]